MTPPAPSPAPAPAPATGAYGLALPTLDDARTSVVRVHGTAGADVWQDLLRTAGLTGSEQDRGALERLLAAMAAAPDQVTSLCARSIRIRLTTYDRLNAAHAIVREKTP